ncbi:conserved hypothetical protein [Sporisorium reilianum SRZ2]|uniref:Protein N-terminal glutamine amidohydrolase n=1 Tax=Sporisorium reilianum (strain SRZ2) TaxID=999809 RepID=E6ZUV5_SPORE|nr:conserved hypothetical protein [Sporisorium reilianum SRZ2]
MSDTTTSTSDPQSSMDKRRKSFTQSLRAKMSRSQSSEACRSSNTSDSSSGSSGADTPPMPPIPRCYSMNAVTLSNGSSCSPFSVAQDDLHLAWTSVAPPAFPASPHYTACYCEENVYLLAQHLCAQLSTVNTTALNIARQQASPKRHTTLPVRTQRSAFVPVWDVHVVFISNPTKTVLLYQQAASKLASAGSPVVWDYHVVAVATCTLVPLAELRLDADGRVAVAAGEGASRSWVYDYDSLLSSASPKAVPWHEYNAHTFRPDAIATCTIPTHFQPMFRCIPAAHFLAHFASDRSHMLHTTPAGKAWSSPPPSWDVIAGREARREGCRNNLMERYVDVNAGAGKDARYETVWRAEKWLARDGPPIDKGLGGSLRSAGGPDVLPQDLVEATAEQKVPIQPLVDEKAEMRQEGEREETKGGRISSPLFPAYLYSSQQHRAAAPPAPFTTL